MSVASIYSRDGVEVLVEDTRIDEGISHITLYRTDDLASEIVLSEKEAVAAVYGLTRALRFIYTNLPAE